MTEHVTPAACNDSTVVLTTVPRLEQADLLISILEAEGVHAYLGNANVEHMFPQYHFCENPLGIKIFVLSTQCEKAQAILRDSQACASLNAPSEHVDSPEDIAATKIDRHRTETVLCIILIVSFPVVGFLFVLFGWCHLWAMQDIASEAGLLAKHQTKLWIAWLLAILVQSAISVVFVRNLLL